MRRAVLADGMHFSDASHRWCRVDATYGAEYFGSLAEAYDAIGTEHALRAEDRELQARQCRAMAW